MEEGVALFKIDLINFDRGSQHPARDALMILVLLVAIQKINE